MRSPGRAGQPSAVRTVALPSMPMPAAVAVRAHAISSVQAPTATALHVQVQPAVAVIPAQLAVQQRPAPATAFRAAAA